MRNTIIDIKFNLSLFLIQLSTFSRACIVPDRKIVPFDF